MCEPCEIVRAVCTARSRFLLCQSSVTNAAHPKYPPQPVVRCDGYRPRTDADEGEPGEGCEATGGVIRERSVTQMLPLFHDPHFTFRFADDRLIPRFHLEGVEAGRRVAVFRLDPVTGERRNQIATATTGDGGWVDLTDPIMVRAGDGFVAVPEAGSVRRE